MKNVEKYICIDIKEYRKIFKTWVLKTNHLDETTASHAADVGKMKITTVLILQGWGLQKIKVLQCKKHSIKVM